METRLREIAGFYFYKELMIDHRRASTFSNQNTRFKKVKEPLLYSKVKFESEKLGGLSFQQQVGEMTKKPIFLNKLCGEYLTGEESNSEWGRNWLIGKKSETSDEDDDSEFFYLQIEDPLKKHRFNISKR